MAGGGQVKFSNVKKKINSPFTVIDKNSNPPKHYEKNSNPPPHYGKMEVEVNDRKSDKKHEWGKYLHTFPKTERMVYYNKVVKDICETCHRLKPQTYIREQQSFRWDTKVKLRELNKAVNFYHNDANGIPKWENYRVKDMQQESMHIIAH